MSGQKKPSEAEEIFSEFEKTKLEKEKRVEEEKPEEIQEKPEEIQEKPEEIQEKPEAAPEISTPEQTDDDAPRTVIYIGTKPIMIYVTATLTQLSTSPTVTIKARGKRITQAVDVSQMIVKRMDSVGYEVSDVRISSDSLTSQDGKQRKVSTIEIDVSKIKNS